MRISQQSATQGARGHESRLAVLIACVFLAGAAAAQVHGIPPSVTSIQNHVYPFLPNAPPSVTSLGPQGWNHTTPWNVQPPYANGRPVYCGMRPCGPGHGGGNGGYGYGGYGYGIGTAVPYYYLYPSDDSGNGYDEGGAGGGSPYLYSGPPGDQTLHIVVEQAPGRVAVSPEEYAERAPEPPREAVQTHEPPAPTEPTVLVFRDGRKQQVTNYAIMGQTVYVFDARTKKIALADLDIPATVKVNDEQGVEFKVPAAEKKSTKGPATQKQGAPAASDAAPKA